MVKRNKEFSKYQKAKKVRYLKKYGECYLIEVKNDIQVYSPKKVTVIYDLMKKSADFKSFNNLKRLYEELKVKNSKLSVELREAAFPEWGTRFVFYIIGLVIGTLIWGIIL